MAEDKIGVEIKIKGVDFFRQTKLYYCGALDCIHRDKNEPSHCALKTTTLDNAGECIHYEKNEKE